MAKKIKNARAKKSVRSAKIKKKNKEITAPLEENMQDRELKKELGMLEGLKERQEQKSEEEPMNKNAFQKENYGPGKETAGKRHFAENNEETPMWFYIASIFAAYLFTVYISIYAAIHFESIEYMNITIVFLFISIVSFFLVSGLYFIYEKRAKHSIAPILFFAGIVSIMIYAFKAVDTSNLVRFSIIYTIIVAALSTYILAVKKR